MGQATVEVSTNANMSIKYCERRVITYMSGHEGQGNYLVLQQSMYLQSTIEPTSMLTMGA